jgi:hypothetical protein
MLGFLRWVLLCRLGWSGTLCRGPGCPQTHDPLPLPPGWWDYRLGPPQPAENAPTSRCDNKCFLYEYTEVFHTALRVISAMDWWLMPEILDTQEAEIRRIMV